MITSIVSHAREWPLCVDSATERLLEELPRPQKVPLDTDPPIPLWNTWTVLAVFLAVVVAEWVLRKRNQLV